MSNPCPLCALLRESPWLQNEHAVAIRDGFPVSTGHTLVVPRAHLERLFGAPPAVLDSVWNLAIRVRSALLRETRADGFNIGINDGISAGQTVPHAHVHVIPRFLGDVEDPRGGVRWVLPEKARYWDE